MYIQGYVKRYATLYCNDIEVKIKNLTIIKLKTDTMCVEGLHKAANNKGFRILYVTPYENQVDLIFARMKEIIADSPLIKTLVTRITNSPYKIEFSNGSQIRGFTTGAASGNGAASVRGQKAS